MGGCEFKPHHRCKIFSYFYVFRVFVCFSQFTAATGATTGAGAAAGAVGAAAGAGAPVLQQSAVSGKGVVPSCWNFILINYTI